MALYLPLYGPWGTIPLTPMTEHYSSHCETMGHYSPSLKPMKGHWWWGIFYVWPQSGPPKALRTVTLALCLERLETAALQYVWYNFSSYAILGFHIFRIPYYRQIPALVALCMLTVTQGKKVKWSRQVRKRADISPGTMGREAYAYTHTRDLNWSIMHQTHACHS